MYNTFCNHITWYYTAKKSQMSCNWFALQRLCKYIRVTTLKYFHAVFNVSFSCWQAVSVVLESLAPLLATTFVHSVLLNLHEKAELYWEECLEKQQNIQLTNRGIKIMELPFFLTTRWWDWRRLLQCIIKSVVSLQSAFITLCSYLPSLLNIHVNIQDISTFQYGSTIHHANISDELTLGFQLQF
jgi:hypothetical protein